MEEHRICVPNEIQCGEDQRLLMETIGKKIKDDAKGCSEQSVPSIYRVPDMLRKVKESAYTPQVVSIGPLHKDDERLKNMEKHKVSYMHSLFRRTKKSDERLEVALPRITSECVDAMLQMEARARSCYAADLAHLNNVEFAEMMLVDGCFIVEFLLIRIIFGREERDPIIENSLTSVLIRHDMFLLENQIPFFVLEKLFQLTVSQIPKFSIKPSLTELLLKYFGNLMSPKRKLRKKDVGACDHILGLLYKSHLPEDHQSTKFSKTEHDDKAGVKRKARWFFGSRGIGTRPKKPQEDHHINKYSATELDRAGVKFQAGKGKVEVEFSTSCWFSSFCGHRTPSEIPTFCIYNPAAGSSCCRFSWLCNSCGRTRFIMTPICIYDHTEPFLRNLIAFEQCCPAIMSYFTSYAFLMDTLINTKEDVELLQNSGVIENYLGTSEDASNIFNNLGNSIVLGKFSFSKQWKQVDEYCNLYCPKHLASLRANYFSSPWTIISVVAALVLFALTVVQTIYAIRSSP